MKKLLSLTLSIILAVSCTFSIDLSAYAGYSADNVCIYINPLLEGSRDEIISRLNKIEAPKTEETPNNAVSFYSLKYAASYPTAEQAASTLRDAMIKRQKSIPVKFLSGTISSSKAIEDVMKKAFSADISTGSVDGDYLRWHIAGASYTGNSSVVQGKYLYDVVYKIEYLTTAEQESKVTSKLNEVNKELSLSDKSEYIKALEIHDYVCNTINYDYNHLNDTSYLSQFSTYGGLFTGYAVCQSYATLFYRLCVENGLKCRVVTSAEHAWNIVKVYGNYYFVDCTWDDTIYDEPEDKNGNFWSNRFGRDYFLYGSRDVDDYMHALERDYYTEEFKSNYPISENSIVCPHEAEEKIFPKTASCSDGFSGEIYCKVCKYPLGEYTVEPNSKHSLTSKTVQPTCTEGGFSTHVCKNCPYTATDSYTNALGHSYKKNITKATYSTSSFSNGKAQEKCSTCGKVKSNTVIYAPKTITLSSTSYTYSGKVITPSVTVKDSKGKALIKNTDYTLTYSSGRKNVGKYSVKITFKGNYSGAKTLYFYIKPTPTSITSASAYKKAFTVRWSKKAAQVTGYQIQYSTKSNFSSAKTIIMGKSGYTAKKITGLATKRKYYVRVRTYKTVGSTNYYSGWSKAKAVTTK